MPDRGVVIGNREEKEEQQDSRTRGDAQENYTLPWVRDTVVRRQVTKCKVTVV